MNYQMITILGPTACGKTDVATHLAAKIHGEIISADSRQVYRGMDIGTGKDLEDYTVDGIKIPYHLIDIAEPGTKYNLYQYQKDFYTSYEDIKGRGVMPILCGGTGLYIEAVLKGYALSPVPQNQQLRDSLEGKSLDELSKILIELKQKTGSNMHNKTDVDTPQRAIRAIEIEYASLKDNEDDGNQKPQTSNLKPQTSKPIDSLIIGINIDRDSRRQKITKRLKQRLDNGMVDEIKGLLDSGIPAENLIYYGLEYKYVTEYVIGKLSYEEMFRQLEIAIHQFAKRQMTWFRGMERRGLAINWIDASLPMDEKVNRIISLTGGNLLS